MSEHDGLLIVSLGTTHGLRVADESLAALLRDAGVRVDVVTVQLGRLANALRRGYPVNDVVEALAARRALGSALARVTPRAVVFSSTTAALLGARGLDLPYAVRLDAPAALNRPGLRNRPLHALERPALARARMVLALGQAGARALPAGSAPVAVLPVPVSAGSREPDRDRDGGLFTAYAPDPKAKGLDVLCASWTRAALDGARLEVFGIEPGRARAFLARRGVTEPEGVRWPGLVAQDEFRATLRRAHAHVVGARWEDFGQAPLEALSDGALLVCTPAGGPFEALGLARELEPSLVCESVDGSALAVALQAAATMPAERCAAYRTRAAELLAPYRPDAVAHTLREQVLPALL